MRSTAILAAGPPKTDRNRHLEKVNGVCLIDMVINACRRSKDPIFVVVDAANYQLQRHLADSECVELLLPKSQKILDTFNAALNISGDVIMVCGDLVNLNGEDIQKFRDTEYSSAMCRYAQPWGHHIVSPAGRVRRADMGDCINLISDNHKDEFLSQALNKQARSLFADFNPGKELNEYIYNDVGTFTSYAFYIDIWGDPSANEAGKKGSVLFQHPIYLDND